MHSDLSSSLYTSGQFAKKAHVSIRTIRYYDQQNILKPSFVNESGARFYSDSDFTRLQQVLLLKYLGFSLEEIRNMTIGDSDYHVLLNSLHMQQKLIKDRIAQMQLVDQAITNTTDAIIKNKSIDWSSMLDLIHLTNMESSMQNQYLNASNISARINLHTLYSSNKQGWFPWVFEQISNEMQARANSANTNLQAPSNTNNNTNNNTNSKASSNISVLELGCGDGSLWVENYASIPANLSITLSDISSGMLRDAKRNLDEKKTARQQSAYEKAIAPKKTFKMKYRAFDCKKIPYEDKSFDVVIADHVLFYCDDLGRVLSEIRRVLRPGGFLIASAYGADHMIEINALVEKFDNRIVLSKDKLYERFGLENGTKILSPYFSAVQFKKYEDSLLINQPEPLIDYILSCHGNQNQYLLDRYTEFKNFLTEQISHDHGNIRITKDAGLFVCRL